MSWILRAVGINTDTVVDNGFVAAVPGEVVADAADATHRAVAVDSLEVAVDPNACDTDPAVVVVPDIVVEIDPDAADAPPTVAVDPNTADASFAVTVGPASVEVDSNAAGAAAFSAIGLNADNISVDVTSVAVDQVESGTFSEFLAPFNAAAQANGTMVGRFQSRFFKKDQFENVFPGRKFAPFICKGTLYCILNRKHGITCVQTDGVKTNEKSKCEWMVPFKFDTSRKVYVVVKESESYNPRHSHPVDRHTVRASARQLISYEKEMTAEEIRFITELGPANLGVTKTRDLMRLKYPGRDFEGPLLHRLLSKGARLHFGSDPDSMIGLMDLGDQIRQTGGVFKVEIGFDSRLTNVFVMKKSMKAYAKVYGDFVITDGTHNMDKYGLIAIFNTLVDGLGLSVMQSYSQFRSEHSDHLIKALSLFSLDLEKGTLMTDDGPAYHIVATHFEKVHLLCTKHYHNKVFGAKSGLGYLADEFETDMFDAIYKDFGSTEKLELHLATCSGKYSLTKGATNFIQSLVVDQFRVCHTHTKFCFSASCKSSQRGEGTNSRMKGGGSKKKELREYNLLQLLQWYLNQVELQEEQSLNIIVKLIEENRQWSKFVQTAWQLQLNKVWHCRNFSIGGYCRLILYRRFNTPAR